MKGKDMDTPITTARKKAGKSLEDVASLLGVTAQTIRNWEARRATPPVDKAVTMAKFYNLNLAQFSSLWSDAGNQQTKGKGENKHGIKS